MSDEESATLAIKVALETVSEPFRKLLDQLLGPAATEVGLSLGDSAKVWRFKRQIRLFQEVKRLVDQSGEDIKPIAPRLFFPILEAASVEDDDEMQTRWAALLSNEAINTGSVHPSFIDILKQMAPRDARFLDRLFDWHEAHPTSSLNWSHIYDRSNPQQMERDGEACGNLVRLGLIVTEYDLSSRDETHRYGGITAHIPTKPKLIERDTLSDVAIRFMKACRDPQKTTHAKSCPECGHHFQGNGWDGIDAHWRAHHDHIMRYEEAWPLIQSGRYKRDSEPQREGS
jgi:hypothetical protein